MEPQTEQRRLTTILAADVVGYSRLMGADEAGTLAALKAHRKELIEPKTAQYNGRTVKLMGDGALMEFASVVDAVRFAVEVQTSMQERNAEVPEHRQIEYRIGINIGDIIVEGDDIYGEGVNVAARIEGLAEPSGICASRTVINHVKGKLDLDFEDLGDQKVKNIVVPVRVHRIVLNEKAAALVTPVVVTPAKAGLPHKWQITGAVAVGLILVVGLVWWQPWGPDFKPASIERMALPLPDEPSIAVLPFDNLSGDQEQDYFADGMSEDLITDLAKVPDLFVISRHSTFRYKDNPTTVQQIAEDLGVRFVFEGSVRRNGDRIRINAQLVDALSGHHVWAERYDGSFADIFDVQDNVLEQIVTSVAVQLKGLRSPQAHQAETDVPHAYDAYLQGWQLYQHGGREETGEAIAHLERAIELDPNYSRAFAALAAAHWRIVGLVWENSVGTDFMNNYQHMTERLAKALEEPTSLAYSVFAEFLARQGRYDEALSQIENALILSPSDPDSYISKARILNATGHADEAEEAAQTAMRYNPHYPPEYLRTLGQALFHQERYAEAVEIIERVVNRQVETEFDFMTLASAYGHLGRIEEVGETIKRYNETAVPAGFSPLTVQESRYWWYGDMYDYHEGYAANLVEGLRRAGVPEGAGSELAYDDYRQLIDKGEGEYTVDGATKIDVTAAKDLHDRGVVFVDVRAAGTYDLGHIPGAINLDLVVDLTEESLSRFVSKEDEVVFSCFGKYCPYSAFACAKAITWGYTRVYHFPGGYPAWEDAGHPVEKADTRS